ncbi:exo 1,3/1,4-beta-D-glucan glucohydrolase [Paraglaciecola aquimarina]|uniref:Exo 1,3/1,4-beta-D-glucan glucohydrolase n=2 Tax=Paraglaciecola algarum TaxID=3050085 RepID=A0ABS9DB50_9ALTE|nr:glycoside hydrolase family 3 protein [Paraglaciecola sp. G1-23]MCF2950050.1 exo 1,3/1,4-beta-D-glucan glucohydrolase [Paraglaciecola sp. G1-23]
MAACSGDKTPINPAVSSPQVKNEIWPKIQSEVVQDPNIETRIESLLATMSLKQKVAQMIQPEIRDITVEDMREYGFGSYLNGGGSFPNGNKQSTPQDWINLAEQMYQASIDDSLDGSTIPTMWGTDAVHGHNNVIGATLFPHNIGLGAANNPDLIEKIAAITATEVMVTGIDWVFAPTVAVVRDDRWGRTYESYSEDPEIVKAYAASIVRGLQGHAEQDFLGDNRVISTVKHFVGDGGTQNGVDQGDNLTSEQVLFDIHAQGYVGGLTAGAQSVMASFNSWHGNKLHGNKYLLTDVLKEKMGFDGFVVGDWNGHGQIKGCSNENCPQAVNAGLDIYMVPTSAWKPLFHNLVAQVESGEISQARIDDAVRRILRVKLRAGLFEKPSPANRKYSGKTELIGQKSHRDIARQAVRESLVLLKNNGNLLPISPKQNILVAGDGADNIGKQAGGWSVTWQGTGNTNADFPGGSSIYDGIAAKVTAAGGTSTLSVDGAFTDKPDVAIVVFGEEPYAEGQGDLEHLAYQAENKQDLALLESFKAQGIPTISVFISGRPMWVNAELNASDAFVAAWLPGTEGAGVAEVILADSQNQVQFDFKGKLAFSWPNDPQAMNNRLDTEYQPLFAYGYGLDYTSTTDVPNDLTTETNVKIQASGLAVFSGKLDPKWSMTLFSAQQKKEVSSNTLTLPHIGYRTIDKNIQEDAFKLDFLGSGKAGVSFVLKNSSLAEMLTNASALVLNIKTEQAKTNSVFVKMACSGQQENNAACTQAVDISHQLTQLSDNTWTDITIDMTCLVQGLSANELVDSLSIYSDSNNSLSISELRFVTSTDIDSKSCE